MSWRERLPPVRGRLLRDEPLGPLTWFRVGGAADALFLPQDEDDLAGFLSALDPGVPVTALGLGSNTLVRDGGVDGVVVRLGKAFAGVEARGDSRIDAGAAALDATLAREAAHLLVRTEDLRVDASHHARDRLVADLRKGLLAEGEEGHVGAVAEQQELEVVVPHPEVAFERPLVRIEQSVVRGHAAPRSDVFQRLELRQFRFRQPLALPN